MNNDEARQWLDSEWRNALDAGDMNPDADIDRLEACRIQLASPFPV